MAYVGRGIDNISNASLLDVITFTDSAGPYNLEQGSAAFTPISAQALVIQVDGVIQSPSSYTISSATITFDSVMAASSTNDFIVHNGVGLVTEPSDDSVTTAKIKDDAVTTAKILNSNVTYAKIQDTTTANRVIGAATAGVVSEVQVVDDMTNFVSTASAPGVTIKGDGVTDGYLQLNCDQNTHGVKIKSPPHSAAQTYTLTLPQSITNEYFLQTDGSGNLSFAEVPGETKPTITSLTPSVVPNTSTAVVIGGTNFTNMPSVEAINATGAIVAADSITYTSAASITATFTLPVDGTYFVRVENPDGNAVRTTSADLTVSDAPAWVTGSGSLGTFAGSAVINETLTATDATSFAITSGAIATPLTFTTGVGSCTITGTQTQHSAAATDSFTVTATDAEGQTAARAFTMTWSFVIGQGAQFN
tara:strand:+ start:732 stop:1991 length:1260 start_codon:yes stop_codon:yes gene_type:complete